MEPTQQPPNPVTRPPRRWPLFLTGFLLFLLGPVLYAVQLYAGYMLTPWYVPGLATLTVVLMALSVRQRGGTWRTLGLVVFTLLCGWSWYHMLIGTREPEYAGPAQKGQKLAAFSTTFADGRAFTQQDLESGQPTVLLFYRGHW